MDKSSSNNEETKESQINKATKDVTKIEHNDSNMKKRDLKDLAKNPAEVMKPIVRSTSLKSDLSVHVVTRWYRSPEIILLERDYGPPIDIWSVG
jgi:serine/threonine protein kinase